MRFSIGAILMFTVPDTIIRSECRGDAHGTIPRRSTSKRDANVAIISIAQHARPNVTGHTDDFRAQFRNASATVVTTNPPGKLWMPSVMLTNAEECLSPSGRTWWSCSHSWRSLKFLQTGTGISGTGGFTATGRDQGLLPLEDPFPEGIEPAERQDGQETNHRPDAPHAEAAQGEDPREEEHRQGVEDDEEERDEVETDGELHPGVAERLGAALIRFELGDGGTAGAEEARRRERHDGERDDHPEINDDRKILRHKSTPNSQFPTPRLGVGRWKLGVIGNSP